MKINIRISVLFLSLQFSTLLYSISFSCFKNLIVDTIHNPMQENLLLETFNEIITSTELDCRNKIGYFSLLMIYEKYPIIQKVIYQTQQKNKKKFAYLDTAYNALINTELIVPMNRCN